jgi:hypothetical protein
VQARKRIVEGRQSVRLVKAAEQNHATTQQLDARAVIGAHEADPGPGPSPERLEHQLDRHVAVGCQLRR